jgi:hypothetical protein
MSRYLVGGLTTEPVSVAANIDLGMEISAFAFPAVDVKLPHD